MTALNGYKTYIVAGATIFFAVAQYWNGASSETSMILTILGALGLSAVRHAISTTGEQ
jgi:hypothetical protein